MEARWRGTPRSRAGSFGQCLGEVGGAAVAGALERNTTLTSLNLRIVLEKSGEQLLQARGEEHHAHEPESWSIRLGEVRGSCCSAGEEHHADTESWGNGLGKAGVGCCRRVAEEHHAHDTESLEQWSWRSRGCSCCWRVERNTTLTSLNLWAMVLEKSGVWLLQARGEEHHAHDTESWTMVLGSRGCSCCRLGEEHLAHENLGAMVLEKSGDSCCRRAGEEHHAHDTGSLQQWSWRSRGAAVAGALEGTPRSRHWILGAIVLEKSGSSCCRRAGRNTTLTTLDLRTIVLDKWGVAVAGALERTLLTRIFGTMVLEKSGVAVAGALERNTTLTTGSLQQWSWRSRCSCCRRAGEEHHAHGLDLGTMEFVMRLWSVSAGCCPGVRSRLVQGLLRLST